MHTSEDPEIAIFIFFTAKTLFSRFKSSATKRAACCSKEMASTPPASSVPSPFFLAFQISVETLICEGSTSIPTVLSSSGLKGFPVSDLLRLVFPELSCPINMIGSLLTYAFPSMRALL